MISQLDDSVGQLSSSYIPILAAPVVLKVPGGADERMANQSTDDSEDQPQSSPGGSKRRHREAVPPAVTDSGEIWAEPVAPSISNFAETLETVTEK